MQHTLQNSIEINGIGLHSGKPVHLVLQPAAPDHGIVFKRVDQDEGTGLIPALYNSVVDTRMCTLIANEHGARVGTIEHLMAALRACNVDNVLIEIDAAEVPIMDGSSKDFVAAIEKSGLQEQSKPRQAIKILKQVRVTDGDKDVLLSPSDVPVYAGYIEFPHATIGRQDYELRLINGNFKHDVADCRTFGFLKEAEALRAMGLGLGGSLDNAVILNDEGVMNPGGLRCDDEFIRHKMLDAVGDLHLAGAPILGAYYGIKAGHAMNNAILHVLFADPTAYALIDLCEDYEDAEAAFQTPGEARVSG
jgi:UDP-3-O-[3-hydroxymyristoyl] N-acetylglucosamine deacetylase